MLVKSLSGFFRVSLPPLDYEAHSLNITWYDEDDGKPIRTVRALIRSSNMRAVEESVEDDMRLIEKRSIGTQNPNATKGLMRICEADFKVTVEAYKQIYKRNQVGVFDVFFGCIYDKKDAVKGPIALVIATEKYLIDSQLFVGAGASPDVRFSLFRDDDALPFLNKATKQSEACREALYDAGLPSCANALRTVVGDIDGILTQPPSCLDTVAEMRSLYEWRKTMIKKGISRPCRKRKLQLEDDLALVRIQKAEVLLLIQQIEKRRDTNLA